MLARSGDPLLLRAMGALGGHCKDQVISRKGRWRPAPRGAQPPGAPSSERTPFPQPRTKSEEENGKNEAEFTGSHGGARKT